MQIAAAVALLILCTFPLGTTAVPIAGKEIHKRSAVKSRNLCSYFSKHKPLSCSFHDGCLEPTFKCKSDGFHIGYSKPRCEAVRQLQQSSSIKHQEFVDWAWDTELCFRPKLLQLAQEWSIMTAPLSAPDPQTLIKYELKALEKLKSCYSESVSSVCNVLSDESNEDLVSDLKELVSVLSISDYYAPAVRQHLREVIKSCSSESATKIAEIAIPRPSKKLLFCAAVADSKDAEDRDILELKGIGDTLKLDMDKFTYADNGAYSSQRDGQCTDVSPIDSQAGQMTNFRLIQWTPGPNDKFESIPKSPIQHSASVSIALFNYTPPMEFTCGNGLREAGEMCDTFGELFFEKNKFGCNSNCQPFTKYECSTDQLALSSCSKPICGDGKRSSLEECDDGNDVSGDGCNEDCEIEPNWECTELSYNVTSICNKPVEQVSSVLSVITPSSVAMPSSVATSSLSTSSVAMTTTTTRTVSATVSMHSPSVQPPIVLSDAYSSAPSSLRDSSVLWVTLVMAFLTVYLLFR